jgi:hypothetical protein
MPDNRGEVIKLLQGSKSTLRRPDGYYAIRPERWYRNVYDGEVIFEGWVAMDLGSGVYGSRRLLSGRLLRT